MLDSQVQLQLIEIAKEWAMEERSRHEPFSSDKLIEKFGNIYGKLVKVVVPKETAGTD